MANPNIYTTSSGPAIPAAQREPPGQGTAEPTNNYAEDDMHDEMKEEQVLEDIQEDVEEHAKKSKRAHKKTQILIMLGQHRGFGGGDHDRLLIIEALKGKIEAVESLAKIMHCDVNAIQTTLCDVRSRLETANAGIDCLKDSANEIKCKLEAHRSDFCNFRENVAREFGDVRYRDLENHGLMKDFVRDDGDKTRALMLLHHEKTMCKFDHLEKEFCELRHREEVREKEFWKQKAMEEAQCRRDDKADYTNVNFGTQITQLTSAINSLVAKG